MPSTPSLPARCLTAAALGIALLLGGCGGDDPAPTQTSGATSVAGVPITGSELTRGAATGALPSVLSVSVTSDGETAVGNATMLEGGAIVADAFLVSRSGGIPKTGIVVRDATGREFPAVVDGVDRVTRLAVLRARELRGVPAVRGSGQPVLGTPVTTMAWLSARRPSVREGTIVTTGRSVRAGGTTEVGLFEAEGVLGSSAIGGPIVNAAGQVVGVTTRAITPRVPGAVVAVPFATVRRVAKALREEGRVRRAYLGVETIEVTPERAAELRLRTAKGLILRSTVDGSPAALAMFREPTETTTVGGKAIPTGGDVIVAFNGRPVATSEELDTRLLEHAPGDRVTVKVIRGDRSVNVPVTLGEG